jgi:metal-responsive CopG/Arc/MetJ family transcriptional regulator
MPKKVLVALPPGLLEQIDFVAQVEHRTRSDLIREALRRYIETFRRSKGPTMSVSAIGPQKVALLTESE